MGSILSHYALSGRRPWRPPPWGPFGPSARAIQEPRVQGKPSPATRGRKPAGARPELRADDDRSRRRERARGRAPRGDAAARGAPCSPPGRWRWRARRVAAADPGPTLQASGTRTARERTSPGRMRLAPERPGPEGRGPRSQNWSSYLRARSSMLSGGQSGTSIPRWRPIWVRTSLISLSDLRPKFGVRSISASVF